MIKLSIIIPVYNLENYISRCLDSCLEQDLDKDEYEIICVDDGSTDNSLSILNKYSEENPNIKVIHKENGGVSSARNIGLDNAGGEYIWFVDGDDLIRANCLRFIVCIMKENDADLMMHDVNITHDENEKYDRHIENISYSIISGMAEIYDACKRPYGGGAWSYIMRRKICEENNLYFRTDMKYSEDLLFVFLYKSYCNRCIIADEYFYYYIMRKSSASHNVDRRHHIDCNLKCIKEYIRMDTKAGDKTDYFKSKLNGATKSILSDLGILGDFGYAVLMIKSLEKQGLYPIERNFHAFKTAKGVKNKLLEIRVLMYTYKQAVIFICGLKTMVKKIMGR